MTSPREPAASGFDAVAADAVWDPERVLAQARSENFPVASALLGKDLRRHFLAIYGYARLVDDVGDEAAGDRSRQLDVLEREVERLYEGIPRHPLVRRLAPTVAAFGIPPRPFLDLIEANRMDQRVTAYGSFGDLLHYCSLSANPVGELVLYALRAHDPPNMTHSDAICSALQITEHLQDLAEDHARGRVYVPEEDLARFGCTSDQLAAGPGSPRLRDLVAFEAGRARELLDSGASLIGRLRGRGRWAVAGFVAGGRAALDALVNARPTDATTVPRPSKAAFLRHFVPALVRGR